MKEMTQIFGAYRTTAWTYIVTASALTVLLAWYALRPAAAYPQTLSDRSHAYAHIATTSDELVRALCLRRECGPGGELP